jgi:CRISPR-associated endonuclease/helicase Cas3
MSMATAPYAHTREGRPPEEWHGLLEHLEGTAGLAGGFASAFGSEAWGELAGRWHDLGKYARDFQEYLLSCACDPAVQDISVQDGLPGKVDHSSAGAIHVYRKCLPLRGPMIPAVEGALAMVIAGHHGGLAKQSEFLDRRLVDADKERRYELAIQGGPPPEVLDPGLPGPPSCLDFATAVPRDQKLLRVEFWTRMLFSALVDADRLDSEASDAGEKARIRARARGTTTLEELGAQLDEHLRKKVSRRAEQIENLAPQAREHALRVHELRAEVLLACRQAADRPPGRFSLTVPTGGGKTLSAMRFALTHARLRGLRRVIMVIPYTSIIEQTAKAYREAFGALGEEAVIEHHSNLDPVKESAANRLASENWDAPIVVTTTVQFFESLHSNRPTACRKLHNIARSVLVFDEVQTLPHGLRAPIFDALNQLVDHYGCSALFCTATQPALELERIGLEQFPHLSPTTEIIPDVSALFRSVGDRVIVEYRDPNRPVEWAGLATEIAQRNRVLVIVHRRQDALDLHALLPRGTFHLSALMCAAHRADKLAEIRKALCGEGPCRVVSTTLVEAGVDVDFPVVYRAYGGIDSLAQAAGRCNREGQLVDATGRPNPGRLVLFRAPSDPPRGMGRGLDKTLEMLADFGGELDLFANETYDRYFRRFFENVGVDEQQVMTARGQRDFPEVAERFRMIDDRGQVAIVVPYGQAIERVDRFRRSPSRGTLRALQPYTVQVHSYEFQAADKSLIEPVHDQVLFLSNLSDGYDEHRGLDLARMGRLRPDAGIV